MEAYYSQHQHKLIITVDGVEHKLDYETAKQFFKKLFTSMMFFKREQYYRTGIVEEDENV